jgi:hypothetical protein
VLRVWLGKAAREVWHLVRLPDVGHCLQRSCSGVAISIAAASWECCDVSQANSVGVMTKDMKSGIIWECELCASF